MRHIKFRLTVLITIVAAAFLANAVGSNALLGYAGKADAAVASIKSTFEQTPPVSGDYYQVVGVAQLNYAPAAPGTIEYCSADSLGRAVCAFGELTASQRAAELTQNRQDITINPAGWPTNAEVTIPALSGISNSKTYSGWMWNRSHLVADSLGGGAILENLVTGTRTQNVGSAQVDGEYAGGMAYAEKVARDYLDSQSDDSCPLYYAATPVYTGEELLPRTVVVDVHSCDGVIDMRVEVTNAANGFTINYATGDSGATS